MSTIYDIAKKAGVSASTVSRALNGSGYCDERTKSLIQKVAQELNYIPDSSAKMLRSKRTKRIVLAIPDICNPFYFDMIYGVNSILEKYDYLMILIYTKHSLDEELKAIQNVKGKIADGMIMVSFNFCEKNIKAINSLNVPVVITNKYESAHKNDSFDYVYVDTYLGIKMATEHLLKQGHEKIAFMGGNMEEQTGRERFLGYRDAIIDAGLRINEKYILQSNYTESGGYTCTRELLKRESLPSAIVAANDLMAIGAMSALEESGLRIPDDMAVVGMDNTQSAIRVTPKLSSVAMMQEKIGRNAAQILMDNILNENSEKKRVRLLPRLVVRDSSVQIG